MSGTREDFDLATSEGDPIAVAQPPGRDLGLRLRGDEHVGPGPRTQFGGAGQVVGMRVCVDEEAKAQSALLEIREVLRDAIDARVDERRITGGGS